jgi:hypothetical protein
MPVSTDTRRERIINVRKLAALDMALHGARFILAEFSFGVVACGAGGVWILTRSGQSALTLLLGVALLSAAASYVVLLLHAVSLARTGDPRAAVAYELEHRDRYLWQYSVQQLLIFVPLAIPILALLQGRRKDAVS